MLHAVIMAGGSGTRFWPASRAARPKQLLDLFTGRPLVAETVARLEGLVDPLRVLVVTNASIAPAVRALLPDVPPGHVVPEPCGRDTLPCIGLAAALALRRDPDAVLAVLPADHVVSPPDAFRTALARGAAVVARKPRVLVTFGVTPTRPATGYGYIERGDELCRVDGAVARRVASFREKPDLDTARRFLAAGTFSWNAGIFVFRADTLLDRLRARHPAMHAALPELAAEYLATGAIAAEGYAALPKVSIDYGLLEGDEDVAVLEVDFAWDDVGSFAALDRVRPGDGAGNRVLGDAVLLDASDNVVVGSDARSRGHLVALVGVSGLVVVHTRDATLVCRKEDAERVKALVDDVRTAGRADLL